ncbi:ABC transporter permease [Xanthomonas sp. LMG 12462]|uniref:ABC transporter permease n=1 Tax=Xanthomonas sp. LMG 12462 TaxID=1591134 RepID=UPI0012652F9A|nr:ABC transporter permease [Xanthomonas sp. LMG 12462]KAB7767687.1 ABC transporter permease [Xanthomonas sp. LMG 12462]
MQKHANLFFLFRQLLARELAARYRTTVLGVLWLILQPLLMLCVYTFVFSGVFKARWAGAESTGDFALMLFAGLVPFTLLSEVLITAPGIIAGQPNFVKKIVFPLPMLSIVKVAAALTTAGIGLAILLIAQVWQPGLPSAWALTAPLILLEMTPMLLGVAWSLSALGVYLRDIGQFVGIISSVLLFLSPIFFPAKAMPAAAKALVFFNPLVTPIEQLRAVTVQNSPPDLLTLLPHFALSIAFSMVAYALFRRLSRGFSDVL